MKSILAVLVALAMIVAAVVGRQALDTKSERDDLRLTVVCDPAAEAFCRAAQSADSRLTIRVESPERTTKAMVDLAPGGSPDFQAWVSVGPWLQMADGRRPGQSTAARDIRFVASSGLVLLTRPGQSLTGCGKPPAGCLPLPTNPVGLTSPRRSGVGLAGLAQVVLAATGTKAGDLDRGAIESGPAGPVIDRVAGKVDTGAGLEQVNARFAGANPLVTIQAGAPAGAGVQVVRSDPAVRAVLQVGILDPRAAAPLSGEPGGRALAAAATVAGWEPAGAPGGGLPEPGVLAALQDAWQGP